MKGRIKDIDFEKFIISLTIRNSELSNHKKYLYELHPLNEMQGVKIIDNEDFPRFYDEDTRRNFIAPRKINHPKFKNMSL